MEHRSVMEGHAIDVWTTSVEEGWAWSYTIDHGEPIEGVPVPHLPESLVLCEGIARARADLEQPPH